MMQKRSEAMEAGAVVNDPVASRTENRISAVDEFVHAGMASLRISAILQQPGVTIRGLKTLRTAGIKTAKDLESYDYAGEIGDREKQITQAWCAKLRQQFATQHRLRFRRPEARFVGY